MGMGAGAFEVEAGDLFGDVVDGDFFTGMDVADRDVAAVSAARVGRARVVNPTSGRFEQNHLAIDDRDSFALSWGEFFEVAGGEGLHGFRPDVDDIAGSNVHGGE